MSVYVYKLNDLTLKQWIAEANSKYNEMTSHRFN